MKNLTENEYSTFQKICSMSQKTLQRAMYTILKKKYKQVYATKDYIITEGNIPIALVAHMDTVFKQPPSDIYYDREKNVIWSPQGLGADDRAGVFAILQIINKTNLRPHIILTTDEELGALGAIALTNITKEPYADMKYIIQLDRRGTNDCVFYACENQEFQEYVESFGFTTAWGSFSDISEICPMWGVAGVNLSVGYMNEHSTSEVLHVNPLLATIRKVINMLKDADNAKYYNYISAGINYGYMFDDYGYGYSCGYGNYYTKCHKCGHSFSEYETVPVKTLDGKTVWYCPDCFADVDIGWCEMCNEAFEKDNPEAVYCKDCRKTFMKGASVKNA